MKLRKNLTWKWTKFSYWPSAISHINVNLMNYLVQFWRGILCWIPTRFNSIFMPFVRSFFTQHFNLERAESSFPVGFEEGGSGSSSFSEFSSDESCWELKSSTSLVPAVKLVEADSSLFSFIQSATASWNVWLTHRKPKIRNMNYRCF